MTSAQAASSGQALAESRMLDTCRITRAAAGTGVLDPVTGLVTGARTTVYQGKCRLRTPGTVSAGSERQSAGDTATLVSPLLSVPISAATRSGSTVSGRLLKTC